jgi:hypothetical protein
MTDQSPGKPVRRLMPVLKTDYDRLWDELGGPADVGITMKSPRSTLGSYCREYPSVRILPVLLRFQPDKASARKHWPWAAFAIGQYTFEQKERKTYADEPSAKQVKALLSNIVELSQNLRSEIYRLQTIANRLEDQSAPLRRAHLCWLDTLVSQAVAGHLTAEVNDNPLYQLGVDSEKKTFLNRLVGIATAAEMAGSRLDPALLDRERGKSILGLPNFVSRCSAIWRSLTKRRPSVNKVTRLDTGTDDTGTDPDFVIFIQELAKVGAALAPSRDQVAGTLRRRRSGN